MHDSGQTAWKRQPTGHFGDAMSLTDLPNLGWVVLLASVDVAKLRDAFESNAHVDSATAQSVVVARLTSRFVEQGGRRQRRRCGALIL